MYKDSAEKAEAIAFIMETISKEVLESIDDTYVSKVEFALRAGQTRTEMRATRKAENEAYRIERDAFYKDLAEENGIDPTSDLASLLRSMVYDKSKGEGDRYRRDLYAEIVSGQYLEIAEIEYQIKGEIEVEEEEVIKGEEDWLPCP